MNTETGSAPILLTVAIAAGKAGNLDRLMEHLSTSGLLNQKDVEIVVAHCEPFHPDVRAQNLRFISCPSGYPFFRLYAKIIESTDSEFIALLDAACPPDRDWLFEARKHLVDSTPIFYGPVECGWNSKDFKAIGYLIEYAQFRPPLDHRLEEYPGNNLVFKRHLIQNESFARSGFQKTFFINKVQQSGLAEPTPCENMRVSYLKSYTWSGYLKRRMSHGRLYGSGRASSLGSIRFLYAGGTIILPLLRCWRILQSAKRSPSLVSPVAKFIAPIFMAECAWSLGECVGYLAGASTNEEALD